jgi:hypothetical protein
MLMRPRGPPHGVRCAAAPPDPGQAIAHTEAVPLRRRSSQADPGSTLGPAPPRRPDGATETKRLDRSGTTVIRRRHAGLDWSRFGPGQYDHRRSPAHQRFAVDLSRRKRGSVAAASVVASAVATIACWSWSAREGPIDSSGGLGVRSRVGVCVSARATRSEFQDLELEDATEGPGQLGFELDLDLCKLEASGLQLATATS